MRVLLTGSSGWLARHLAPQLRQAGHDVIGMDITPSAETAILGSIARRDDVRRDDVRRAFEEGRPDMVVHSATLHKPDIGSAACWKP